MIEYYDISGCYILRPWSMAIWEIMHVSIIISLFYFKSITMIGSGIKSGK